MDFGKSISREVDFDFPSQSFSVLNVIENHGLKKPDDYRFHVTD